MAGPGAGGPGVEDRAPDFSLDGTGAGRYSLEDLRAGPAVLVFYPGDETSVCTRQLCSYSADLASFEGLGATVWGISPQDVDSHERFVAKHGLTMPLLTDTDKAVGRAYGIVGPAGLYRRSVFVVDAAGVIRYVHRALVGLTYRPTAELVDAVRMAKSPA